MKANISMTWSTVIIILCEIRIKYKWRSLYKWPHMKLSTDSITTAMIWDQIFWNACITRKINDLKSRNISTTFPLWLIGEACLSKMSSSLYTKNFEHDGTSVKFPALSKPLVSFIYLSLITTIFSDKFQIIMVTPQSKKGHPLSLDSYPSIALPPSIAILYEKNVSIKLSVSFFNIL